MGRMLFLVMLIGASVLALGFGSVANAGIPLEVNTITVDKDVVGPVPPGTEFDIVVTCRNVDTGTVLSTHTVTFDEGGGTATVPAPEIATCTAVETETGGATVSYACDDQGSDSTTCLADNQVKFNRIEGATATLEVTNTFETPTTTTTTTTTIPVASPLPLIVPVVVQPRLTG